MVNVPATSLRSLLCSGGSMANSPPGGVCAGLTRGTSALTVAARENLGSA